MIREKRKNHKRVLIIVSIVFAIVVPTFYIYRTALSYLVVRAFVSYGTKESQQSRKRLLCETDYVELLKACRDILREVHIENRSAYHAYKRYIHIYLYLQCIKEI